MNENEVIRYEKFCQFKAEIRPSKNYLIVGIDVAKERPGFYRMVPSIQ